MDVSLFDFDLPQDRIAIRPASPRHSARMLVVHRDGSLEHSLVRDLPNYLSAGDALVANDTKVFPARLLGQRQRDSGPAKIEMLLVRRLGPNRYSGIARPARKLAPHDALVFGGLGARVLTCGERGYVEVQFELSGVELDAALAKQGEIPLPPYIATRRAADASDREDYQTTFAAVEGSVAAPTAGLHFTPELFARLQSAGVEWDTITLHIGLGTFQPVSVSDIRAHRMHSEHAVLSQDVAARLNAVHARGRRVIAVGTTSLRTLESAALPDGHIEAFAGDTDIFITPGYHFRVVDGMLTNFHLPRSTLFMLVSAMMGLEIMKSAYTEAIARDYRFYSYGDACLLLA